MPDNVPTSEGAPTEAGPHLLLGGTFAIYARPDGALELVTETDARGYERRTIPAAVLKMINGNGPFAKMAAKMFGAPAEDPT